MTREETIKQLESLYDHCENMRSGDNDFAVWERDCEAIKIALSALRPVSREQVEKVWRGYWIHDEIASDKSIEGKFFLPLCNCSRCGGYVQQEASFCPHCGAPMTDEAVQTLLKRLEALKDD